MRANKKPFLQQIHTRFAYIVTNDVQKAIRSNCKKTNLLRRNVIQTRVRGKINENRPDGKQLLIHVVLCVCVCVQVAIRLNIFGTKYHNAVPRFSGGVAATTKPHYNNVYIYMRRCVQLFVVSIIIPRYT